jgi:hypothetical protein
MAIIPAVVTDLARQRWPKMQGGLLAHTKIDYFKVGEGGWFYNSLTAQREPRTPDPTLTDLDIILDLGRAPGSERYDVGENLGYFQKSLVPTDFFYEIDYILRTATLLDFPEYNAKDDGTLIYDIGSPYTSPEIWELGLFDEDDVMVVYCTFVKEIKESGKQIENIPRLIYGS